MGDFLPEYRRGESLIGYVVRCSTGRTLTQNVEQVRVRQQICKEHAEQMREAMRQPFQSDGRKK
jgi:hypothetical protein